MIEIGAIDAANRDRHHSHTQNEHNEVRQPRPTGILARHLGPFGLHQTENAQQDENCTETGHDGASGTKGNPPSGAAQWAESLGFGVGDTPSTTSFTDAVSP